MRRSKLVQRLFLAIGATAAVIVACSNAPREPGADDKSLHQNASCECPEGYVFTHGGCCPACYFETPPCLVPCFICDNRCGLTGDACDYSQGLTCCAGPSFCCPGGAQSRCSDYACAP
jgi:hypothetical protein